MRSTLVKQFHRQVKRFPGRTALVSKDISISYKELNHMANQVANTILKLPENSNKAVAILLEHDVPLIAALLGVLKAGKFYVPLSSSFPREMLRSIVMDSDAFALITDRANQCLAEGLCGGDRDIINIERLEPGRKQRNPRVRVTPRHLAYLIYTSGSSGRPKGVLHNHRNILRMVNDYNNYLEIRPGCRVSMLSAAAFSMSLIDIFPTLLTGATLCLLDIQKNGSLVQWLAKENITHYQSTTTIFSHLLETVTGKLHLPALQVVKLGGEPVYRYHWEQFNAHFAPGCLFVNGYGLSEILVISQFAVHNHKDLNNHRLPVGFVSPGCEIVLLDQDGKPLKPGEPGARANREGEIAIKSDYLFLHYWRQPGLTGKVLKKDGSSKKKIFHTGDMGRMNRDGSLHICGRKDLQVKIRGVRVELEAIETLLCSHPQVKQALVNAVEDGKGGKQLVAMVVTHGQDPPAAGALQEFLCKKLPLAMIPSTFHMVTKLPVTASNKVDRQFVGPLFYKQPKWEPSVQPPAESHAAQDKNDCWVVFTDQVGLGEQLAKRLRSRGTTVVTVKAGESYAQHPHRLYTVRPGRNEDYTELATKIEEAGLLPVKVVFLWTVSPANAGDEPMMPVDLERGVYGPVYLMQAFTEYWNSKLEVELVTHGLFNITGKEPPQPAAGLVMGPFQVLPREYSHISCRLVDVHLIGSCAIEETAVQLLQEFETGAAGQLAAYRDKSRYLQALEQSPVPGCYAEPSPGTGLPTAALGGRVSYAPPRNDEEHMLANIWEKVLKVDHIGIKDHFFHCGGNSLTASVVFSEIEATFGVPLTLGTLVQSPTIESLAKVLREKNSAPQRRCMVPVQPNGEKRPFFCVHPLTGNVLRIAGLGKYIPKDQPFYAIQAVEPVDRIDVMAANYVREVRAVQPQGPYLLGGRCFGGMVAFEMVRLLAAEGQKTDLLVILDGMPPTLYPRVLPEALPALNEHSAGTPRNQRLDQVFNAHIRARAGCCTRPFPVEMVLLGSRHWREIFEGTVLEEWRKAVEGEGIYHEIPCHHLTMLKEPHIAKVAALLNRYLEKAAQ